MKENLVLFDNFGDKERWIWESILCMGSEITDAGDKQEDFEALVLADRAFLPEHVTSIYDAYIGEWEPNRKIKDLYYAFIPVPEYWMVTPYLERGAIFDMGVKKGEIYVRNPKEKRMVEYVEWLDQGKAVRRDYYDRYGVVYKSEHISSEGNLLETSYYTSDRRELLCLNNSNNIFGALTKKKLMRYYHTEEDWIREYLDELCLADTQVIITSDRQKEMLGDLQSNIMDWSFLENVNAGSGTFCFVSKETARYIENKKESKDILILTTSDQLEALEQIVDALPQCRFHIAATTAFSPRIYELEKEKYNIYLYSTIGYDKLEELLEMCAIYLDINRAYAYPNSIEKAALHGLVMMGFRNSIHSAHYFLEENIFAPEETETLISRVQEITADLNRIKLLAVRQNEMQKETVRQLMRGK